MNIITDFFHVCSGANRAIIKRSPTESSRYAGIGATIFFTGLLAGSAAGYAIYTVFENYIAAIAFGLIWGTMIFNLDRFIVSGMRKTGSLSHELLVAFPRLVLAILIAIVISKPLELRIFEKEINNELILLEQELRTEQENAVRLRHTPQINSLKTDIENFNVEISKKTNARNLLMEEARKEADGTGGTGLRNAGPVYRLKKSDADKADLELRTFQDENSNFLANKGASLDSIEKIIAQEILLFSNTSYNGLAARLEAMFRISEKSSAIKFAEWFILLLFIAIESSPIIVKLISKKGPYDDRLMIHEHLSHVIRTKQIAIQSHSTRSDSNNLSQPEKEWLEQELSNALK